MNVRNDVGQQPNELNKNNTATLKEHMGNVSVFKDGKQTSQELKLSWGTSDVSVCIYIYILSPENSAPSEAVKKSTFYLAPL